jgi:hypothetical protein
MESAPCLVSLVFAPDPHHDQPSRVTLVVFFFVFWSFMLLFVYYWPFIVCSFSQPSFSVLEFPSSPPVVEQEQEQRARRGQGQEQGRAGDGGASFALGLQAPAHRRTLIPSTVREMEGL